MALMVVPEYGSAASFSVQADAFDTASKDAVTLNTANAVACV
jgi:hypothetical protein